MSASAHAQQAQRQYVFALDDSGSMGHPRYAPGERGNDPYRLSRFAVRALLAGLPDDARATVITMTHNGADTPRGETPVQVPPLAPLGEGGQRALLDRLLSPDGAFMSHDNARTPCRRILDGLQRVLNTSWAPGAVQTAVFLSDGRCTDGLNASHINAFLGGLRSEDAARQHESPGGSAGAAAAPPEGQRPFQFYFICMGSDGCSRELVTLAEQTGGVAFAAQAAATAPNPRELLDVFAQAIARSQGVCPTIHEPGDARLAATPGAAGTRLVGVTAAGGTIAMDDAVSSRRSGGHRWNPDGLAERSFAFAAGYVPGTAERQLPVSGSGWRVIAIPEFQELHARTRLLRGTCEQNQARAQANANTVPGGGSLRVGADHCLELTLVGSEREPLRYGSLGRAVTPTVTIRHEREGAAPTVTTPAPRRDEPSGRERYLFALPATSAGTWTFEAQFELARECLGNAANQPTGGRATVRRAPTASWNAVSVHFDASLADEPPAEPYAMAPGGRAGLPAVTLRGNFATGDGRSVQLRRVDPAPSAGDGARRCVQLRTNNDAVVRHGESVELDAMQDGGRIALALVADADCGWQASGQAHDVAVAVALVERGHEISSHEFTFRYVMDNDAAYGCADGSSLTLTSGGDPADLACGPRPRAGTPAEFRIEVTQADSSGGALPRGLRFDLMPPGAARQRDGLRRKRDRQTWTTVQVTPGADAPYPTVLRAQARRCCTAGTWFVPLTLTRVVDGQPVGESTTHDVQVTVVSGSWWSCYGFWTLIGFLCLLGLLLLWGFINLIRCVHLLPSSGKGLPVARNVVAGSSSSDRLVMNEHPDWQYSLTVQRALGSGFRRWLAALRHGDLVAIARGTHWFETVSLTGDHEGITGMKAEPQLGTTALSNQRGGAAPDKVKPGMYLRAGTSRVINVLGVKLPELGLIPIGPDDYNALVREMRRKDPEARDLSRAAAGVVDIRGKYIITENAERAKKDEPLGVVVNTE